MDRGVVRILDIAFVAKDPDGSVSGIELGDLKQVAAAFAALVGSWWRAAVSLFRPSWPPSTRSRPPTDGGTVMPGLLRGVVRTAAIAGTATAVSNRVSRRQAECWQQQESYPYGQPQPAYEEQAPEYAAPPQATPAPDPIQQLKDRAALREQGVLSEEEFAAQKAKILNT